MKANSDFQDPDIQLILESFYKADMREKLLQIAHRRELVQLWNIEQGAKVLEIGCGQGYMTVILAAAVGESGHVLAFDSAPPERWLPPMGEAHASINASPLGRRITFQVSTNVLDSAITFSEHSFDLVVFSYSSWFLSEAKLLLKLFQRVRPWARSLGYAEWEITPRSLLQVPHMLAVLLQNHLKSCQPEGEFRNVETLILSQDARTMAEEAGWSVQVERTLDTSTVLHDGWEAELQNTLHLADMFMHQAPSAGISTCTQNFIASEKNLLLAMTKGKSLLSLPTYIFFAE